MFQMSFLFSPVSLPIWNLIHKLRNTCQGWLSEISRDYCWYKSCLKDLRVLLIRNSLFSKHTQVLALVMRRRLTPVRGSQYPLPNLLQALHLRTSGRVRVYELSSSSETTRGVWQGCLTSPFLFNFLIDEVMGDAVRLGVSRWRFYSNLWDIGNVHWTDSQGL